MPLAQPVGLLVLCILCGSAMVPPPCWHRGRWLRTGQGPVMETFPVRVCVCRITVSTPGLSCFIHVSELELCDLRGLPQFPGFVKHVATMIKNCTFN